MARKLLASAIRSLIRHRDRRPGNPAVARTSAVVGVSTGVAYQLVADDGEEDEGPPEEVCDGFLSGFFDWTNPFRYGSDGYFSRAIFLRAIGRSGWENSVELLGSLPGPGYSAGCSPYLPFPGSSPTTQGSKYSGTMRKVVQLLQGMLRPIPYTFCFGQTHGIYIASNGSHWVIEISAWAGVTAWEIPVCEVLTPERQAELNVDLPYIPSINDGLPPLSERVVLASPSAMSDYAGSFPFYLECGWAFSYNGREAQNVMWTWPLHQEWKFAHRFKVSISGTSAGPTSANVSLLETTYLWGERFGGPKFPYYLPTGGQSLLTFDLRADPPIAGSPWAPGGEEEIPFYVYYTEGSNVPIVWYMSSLDLQGKLPDDDPAVDEQLDVGKRFVCSSGDDYYELSPGVGSAGHLDAGTFGTYSLTYSDNRVYAATGPITDIPDPDPAYEVTGSIVDYWSEQDGGWCWGVHKSGGAARPWASHYLTHRRYASDGDKSKRFLQAFIIPIGDRETIFKFEKKRTTVTRSSVTTFTSGQALGAYYLGCRPFTYGASYCNPGGPLIYKTLLCDTPSEGAAGVNDTYFSCSITRSLGGMFICQPYGPDDCYAPTEAWIPDEVNTYLSSCPISGSFEYGPLEEVEEFDGPVQELFVHNNSSGQMESVKTWDEYDPLDPYTAVVETDVLGAQVMVATKDAFTGAAFVSNEMNGYEGGEYHYFGTPQLYYPLEALGPGLDRGFFGVPFRPGET